MLSPLRNRFGIPGVISVIALVFAMFGGAYAATNSGKATGSAKAKKGPRGPKGPAGPAGPAGATGPAGPKGDKGDAGSNGSNGSNGTGAITEPFSGAAHGCTVGGVVVKSASPDAAVCNGVNGTNGQTGFTETLPEGKTETGIWGTATSLEKPGTFPSFSISFPIPLTSAPEVIVVLSNEESKPGCPGRGGGEFPSTEGERFIPTVPQAALGKLCIYTDQIEHANETVRVFRPEYVFSEGKLQVETGPGASQSGGILRVACIAEECGANGSWAVTGPEE